MPDEPLTVTFTLYLKVANIRTLYYKFLPCLHALRFQLSFGELYLDQGLASVAFYYVFHVVHCDIILAHIGRRIHPKELWSEGGAGQGIRVTRGLRLRKS